MDRDGRVGGVRRGKEGRGGQLAPNVKLNFAYAGPTVWNSLPDNLRDSTVGPENEKLIRLPVCLILRRQGVRVF